MKLQTPQMVRCNCCKCSPCKCQSKRVPKNEYASSGSSLLSEVEKEIASIDQSEEYSENESLLRRAPWKARVEKIGFESREDGTVHEKESTSRHSSPIVLKKPRLKTGKSSEDEKEIAQIEPSEEHPSVKISQNYSCECLANLCSCPGGHYSSSRNDEKISRKETKSREDVYGKTPQSNFSESTRHYITPVTSFYGKAESLKMQRTLMIIRPAALKFKDVILRAISSTGFHVLSQRMIHLSPEQVFEIFNQYYGDPVFPYLAASMTLAPVLAICIVGQDVIRRCRCLTGPDGTLPAEWFFPNHFLQTFGKSDVPEALLLSENLQISELENRYFFPNKTWDETMKKSKNEVEEYLMKFINPILTRALSFVSRRRPKDPIIVLAEYLLKFNPFQPSYTPATYFSNL